MNKRFQTKVRHARFHVSGFSPEQMISIGEELISSIKDRTALALDVYDQPAAPLGSKGKTGGYAGYKSRVAPPAIRNLRLSGRTMRSLKVLSASENRAVIGFTDPITARRIAINSRKSRQFGVSPRDKLNLIRAVKDAGSPISVKSAA
jgi:hypothetical protein